MTRMKKKREKKTNLKVAVMKTNNEWNYYNGLISFIIYNINL